MTENHTAVQAVLNENHGEFADGYTSEDVERVLGALSAATGTRFVVVWEYEDRWGTGGNSDLYLVDGDTLRETSTELWAHLNGDQAVHLSAQDAAALAGQHEIGPVYGTPVAALVHVSTHNLAAVRYEDEAPR